jgi:hypothetical protein
MRRLSSVALHPLFGLSCNLTPAGMSPSPKANLMAINKGLLLMVPGHLVAKL